MLSRVTGLAVLAFVLGWSVVAHAEVKSIGTHSDCKKLSGANRATCTKCLNSGAGFFNKEPKTGTWVCGATSDMTPNSVREKGDPWPKPLTSMPVQQKSYVKIPAGTFHIGTPRSPEGYGRPSEVDSDVKITRPFLIKATEVTYGEYFFVMKKMPRRYKAGCMDCPVLHPTWLDAVAYMNALSKLEKLEACYVIKGETVKWKGLDCKGYRLPTEAEWEYAARGGTKDPLHGAMDDIAWHKDNSESKVHPVGGKAANGYGLYDMVGNAAEWTWDAYEEAAFATPQTDPVIGGLKMTDIDADRTIRGGEFLMPPDGFSVAYRNTQMDPNMGGDTIGFRPVRTVKP